jgi:hypothetical protein
VFDRVHATHNRPKKLPSSGLQLSAIGKPEPVTVVDVRELKANGFSSTAGMKPAREQTILQLPTGIIGGPRPGTAGSTIPVQPSVVPDSPGAITNPLNHVPRDVASPKRSGQESSDRTTTPLNESAIIERAAARRAQKAEIEAKAVSSKRRK